MKKLFTIFVVLSALVALTACNTVDGIGQDLEDAGDSVQDAFN